MNFAIRINLCNSFSHGFYLGHTKGRTKGMNLPIDVGLGDVIHVQETNFTDPTAGQRLSSPGTYAANSNDRHMTALYATGSDHTEKTLKPPKTSLGVYLEITQFTRLLQPAQPVLGGIGRISRRIGRN
jgi:hypothetical protein